MNRVQEVKKAYPKYADLAIQIAEPKHKNKYLMWIASQLANKHTQEDVKATVTAFNKDAKRLKYTDIYSYKDLKILENEIKDLELSKRQVEIFSKEMGSVKIYSDDSCTLIRMNSKKAMLYYGKASRWCVAMEGEDYWESYSANGNVFYVLLDKEKCRKYAIQKKGLLDVTIWEENDNEIYDIEAWVNKNIKFELAVFACLHDREDPMLFKIKHRKTTKEEVVGWLKHQHESTIKFIESELRGAGFYLVDTYAPVTNSTIKYLSHLTIEDLQNIQGEHKKFIDEVVKYLSKHPKIKVKSFRFKLGHLIPDPEVIIDEESACFIRMKKDPSVATKLLNSTKNEVWRKALEIAEPGVILSLLAVTGKTKRSAFIRRLKTRTCYENLVSWLSAPGMPKIPDNVWSDRASCKDDYVDDEDD